MACTVGMRSAFLHARGARRQRHVDSAGRASAPASALALVDCRQPPWRLLIAASPSAPTSAPASALALSDLQRAQVQPPPPSRLLFAASPGAPTTHALPDAATQVHLGREQRRGEQPRTCGNRALSQWGDLVVSRVPCGDFASAPRGCRHERPSGNQGDAKRPKVDRKKASPPTGQGAGALVPATPSGASGTCHCETCGRKPSEEPPVARVGLGFLTALAQLRCIQDRLA